MWVADLSDKPSVRLLLSRLASPLFVATWIGGLGYGSYLLATYEMGAGGAGRAPIAVNIEVHHGDPKPRLMVFFHPRCPCSLSTVAELERLLVDCGEDTPSVVAYFFDPSDEPDEWVQSDLWNKTEAIPDVRLVADVDGETALFFGAETSGQVLLYGVDGELLFRGGITGGRGHEGGNRGRSAILAHLKGIDDAPGTSPVFGCRIQ